LERALGADPTGELRAAWVLKEHFRDWYLAADPEQARTRLGRWYREVERSGIAEFADLARTVRAWEGDCSPTSAPASPTGPPRGSPT
jgi:hypothetical protein